MASGGDIHFPPGQRRGKPSFEPPPWERDQFDELARRKQAEKATQDGRAEPLGDAGGEPRQAEGPAAERSQGAPVTEEVSAEVAETPAAKTGGGLDQKRVDVLMMGLRAEEPRPEKMYWRIVAGSGVVSILIGLMITTWAVVVIMAPKRAGSGELVFEAMLLILGLSFIGGGLWVIVRSLRQQGVL